LKEQAAASRHCGRIGTNRSNDFDGPVAQGFHVDARTNHSNRCGLRLLLGEFCCSWPGLPVVYDDKDRRFANEQALAGPAIVAVRLVVRTLGEKLEEGLPG
jgi:hypothetical protein